VSERRLTRSQRENKAFRLVVTTGTFGVLTVASFLAALVTAFSFGWFFAFLIATVVSLMLLRGSVR